ISADGAEQSCFGLLEELLGALGCLLAPRGGAVGAQGLDPVGEDGLYQRLASQQALDDGGNEGFSKGRHFGSGRGHNMGEDEGNSGGEEEGGDPYIKCKVGSGGERPCDVAGYGGGEGDSGSENGGENECK